jgi:leucyl aminopeptidase
MTTAMKFSFCEGQLADLDVDLLAIGAFEDLVLDDRALDTIDRAFRGGIAKIVADEEFKGKAEQTLLIHTHGIITPRRLFLVGLGKRDEFDVPDSRLFGAAIVGIAQTSRVQSVAVLLPSVDAGRERASQFLAEGIRLAAYRFDDYRADAEAERLKLKEIKVFVGEDGQKTPHLALSRADVVASAVGRARDLVNRPASELTPVKLADYAEKMASKLGLECKILGPKECEKLKMNLFLAVSRASAEEPRFIHLTYRPKGKEKPSQRIVLVGKGVTFDSGGLSLKPTASMLDMKADMAGAATMLGVISGIPALGLKSEIHLLIAATENMISGSAYKLGDVITGSSGKSVEIVNTDAEGRLTLADALTYALKLEPNQIIDAATLTGACVVALGPHIAGLMSNDNAMAERLLGAARRAGEDFWQLPLPKRLMKQLETPVADIKNAGERWGGALTAGLFLKEFVAEVPWTHLDIAGPAFAEKTWAHVREGGTGFGVATLLEYLSSHDASIS